MGDRVKVACINWGHDDAPKALAYVLRDGEALAETFHATWEEALQRANRTAVILGRTSREGRA